MPPLSIDLTPPQVQAVRVAYLSDNSVTIKQLASLYGVPPHKISAILKGQAYENFKTEYQGLMAGVARDRLAAATELAATEWIAAMPIAKSKGDHRPMKDLLIATKVIDPQATAPQVLVQIGIKVDLTSASEPAIDVTPAAPDITG